MNDRKKVKFWLMDLLLAFIILGIMAIIIVPNLDKFTLASDERNAMNKFHKNFPDAFYIDKLDEWRVIIAGYEYSVLYDEKKTKMIFNKVNE